MSKLILVTQKKIPSPVNGAGDPLTVILFLFVFSTVLKGYMKTLNSLTAGLLIAAASLHNVE